MEGTHTPRQLNCVLFYCPVNRINEQPVQIQERLSHKPHIAHSRKHQSAHNMHFKNKSLNFSPKLQMNTASFIKLNNQTHDGDENSHGKSRGLPTKALYMDHICWTQKGKSKVSISNSRKNKKQEIQKQQTEKEIQAERETKPTQISHIRRVSKAKLLTQFNPRRTESVQVMDKKEFLKNLTMFMTS